MRIFRFFVWFQTFLLPKFMLICFQPILWHFCPFTLFPENAFSCLLNRLTICMAAKQAFSPLSTRGGGCHPLTDYSKSHENQKESDLSHLGNLKYGTSFVVILVKKNWGYPLQGGYSKGRERWRVSGCLAPEIIRSRHFKKLLMYGLEILVVYMSFLSL